MVLTITNGHATIFSAGEVFDIYGDDYSLPYIMDSDDTEYSVADLIADGVEFRLTPPQHQITPPTGGFLLPTLKETK